MDDNKDTINQMVNAIAGESNKNSDKSEEKLRQNLSMRAMEYFMFMDDDDDCDI